MNALARLNEIEVKDFCSRAKLWRDSFPFRKESVLARRPLIVEVCGTPKAGKSTLINYIAHLFRRCDLRTNIITERAEVNPLPEKIDPSYNSWNLANVLSKLLTAADSNDHIVLIDRGLLDCNVWLNWHGSRRFASNEELKSVHQFIRTARWWSLVDLAIVAIVPPSVALQREPFGTFFEHQEIARDGVVPRVMQQDVLKQYNSTLKKLIKNLFEPKTGPKIWHLDMVKNDLESAALIAGEKILSVAEDMVPEKTYVLGRHQVSQNLFLPGFKAKNETVAKFIRDVDSKSTLVDRLAADQDPLSYVKPIALGVIRHNHHVLLLRRKELNKGSYMHNKYVICAGGHLRADDKIEGKPGTVERGLKRELLEELRLAETPELVLRGLVYDADVAQYFGHIGIVYEVLLNEKVAALARSQTEFKEKSGAGVGCRFVSVNNLGTYYNEMDKWSRHIVSGLFGICKDRGDSQAALF